MLIDYIIIYDCKTEGKERKKDNRHIKVHIGTLRYYVHLFEIKLQRCLYKGTIVYIFEIVFCVCCMYSTWHTVMDTCTFTFYFILFCSITVHVSGIK